MKVLIMIISDKITNNNLRNIYEKIIIPLKKDNIDTHIATCVNINYDNIISKNSKYKFEFDGYQLSKVCYVVNKIDNNDYEYYIKTRPDIFLNTTIDKKFLLELSKNKINSRCRCYKGPPIDLKFGMSCPPHDIRKGHIQYNDKIIINPDDQMYIFHKSIKKAFLPITSDTYLNYCKQINNKYEYWIDDWMLNETFWRGSGEKEGHHKFIWYSRGFDINPIGLDIRLNERELRSSHLFLK